MSEHYSGSESIGRQIDRMRRVVGHLQVVPSLPKGRRAQISDEEPGVESVSPSAHEDPLVRALFISYVAADGKLTERRITVRQMIGQPPEILLAWCHERKAPRNFRLDRIKEAIDPESGEVYDVAKLAEMFVGEMKPVDPALRRAINVLVFLARCDGRMHPSEWEAIDDALGRYLLRFGGTDADHAQACKMARQVAPSGDDALISMKSFHASAKRQEIAKWLEQSMGKVIDADGTHQVEEFEWVLVMRDFIDTMRWGHARS